MRDGVCHGSESGMFMKCALSGDSLQAVSSAVLLIEAPAAQCGDDLAAAADQSGIAAVPAVATQIPCAGNAHWLASQKHYAIGTMQCFINVVRYQNGGCAMVLGDAQQ